VIVEIRIDGVPAPQGSKNPFGGEANKRTRPWRAAVSAAGADAMGERGLLDGPLSLEAAFVFSRPKSHFGTGRNAHLLKRSAPTLMTGPPDVDKLLRAICDSLQGVCYRNDSQVAVATGRKLYGRRAYCQIFVRQMPQPLPLDVPSRFERILDACGGDAEQAQNVEMATRGTA
jgi:Holliday junction resolvase RusA-like endonuclease